jgi:hypothetical protein
VRITRASHIILYDEGKITKINRHKNTHLKSRAERKNQLRFFIRHHIPPDAGRAEAEAVLGLFPLSASMASLAAILSTLAAYILSK